MARKKPATHKLITKELMEAVKYKFIANSEILGRLKIN